MVLVSPFYGQVVSGLTAAARQFRDKLASASRRVRAKITHQPIAAMCFVLGTILASRARGTDQDPHDSQAYR